MLRLVKQWLEVHHVNGKLFWYASAMKTKPEQDAICKHIYVAFNHKEH